MSFSCCYDKEWGCGDCPMTHVFREDKEYGRDCPFARGYSSPEPLDPKRKKEQLDYIKAHPEELLADLMAFHGPQAAKEYEDLLKLEKDKNE